MGNSAFEYLTPAMQKKIWDMGWSELTEIQEAAIPAIINSQSDIVLSAETASGKTEAAFLPILSLLDEDAGAGLKVIYISPLKALINDQFDRITGLCSSLDIPVYRWHGDIGGHIKRRFSQMPSGVLEITPESIESLFINRTDLLEVFFGDIRFIIVDEIHAFLGTDRGVHLQSLLYRARRLCRKRPRTIALSATIGDMRVAQAWVNPSDPDSVAVVSPEEKKREVMYCITHFDRSTEATGSSNAPSLPEVLVKDLRELTRDLSSLIFCNAKADVEELCYLLNKAAAEEGAGQTYYAHHGSIDRKEREYVESQMRAGGKPKSVVCSSTLELGIDVGNIDMVVQIDSTFSVTSLKQRLGRSGRRKGAPRVFQLYSTTPRELLQATAVTELFLEDWVEPTPVYGQPFDILFHQLLSVAAERNGIQINDITDFVMEAGAFTGISHYDLFHLLEHMLEKQYLQQIPGSGEIIVGTAGEWILRGKEFYGVFGAKEQYEVVFDGSTIGFLSKSEKYNVGVDIILAGRLWTILQMDRILGRIYVGSSTRGERPVWIGPKGNVHQAVRTRMHDLLGRKEKPAFLEGRAATIFETLQKEWRTGKAEPHQRVIRVSKAKGPASFSEEHMDLKVDCYAGDIIARTLCLVISRHTEFRPEVDGFGCLKIPAATLRNKKRRTAATEIADFLAQITEAEIIPEDLFEAVEEDELEETKFGKYLPDWAVRRVHSGTRLDIGGMREFLNSVEFVVRIP